MCGIFRLPLQCQYLEVDSGYVAIRLLVTGAIQFAESCREPDWLESN